MNVIVQIPDDVARRMAAGGGDLERRTLEAQALKEYKAGRLEASVGYGLSAGRASGAEAEAVVGLGEANDSTGVQER